MPITPASASIAISTTQALTSSGVTSPKWYVPSGLGSLSGVSGSNATYNAPGTATIAIVRAAEEFWAAFYDNTGSSGSNNSFTGLNTTRGISNASAAGAVGVGVEFFAEAAFFDNANHSIGFLQAGSSATFRLCSDGKFRVNGTQEGSAISGMTTGSKVKAVIENVSGNNVFRVYVDDVLAYTGTTVIGGLNLHVEMRAGAGSSTTTLKHPELLGSWSGWVKADATMTVTAPLDASFTLGSASYNYGEAVSASATSTGGTGDRENAWNIDEIEVVPSNGNYLNPTFAGLSLGDHEIELVVTDDLGSDTASRSVFIGSIAGEPSIPHTTPATYTTNVPTPTWTVQDGLGSINSSGIFTPPTSGNGQSTIRAANGTRFATKTILWGFPRKEFTSSPDEHTFTGLPTEQSFRVRGRSKDLAGNWSEWSEFENIET
jgi:hypothetical protein